MNTCASSFMNYLNQGDIKYSVLGSNKIAINFSGKNCSSIRTIFSFSDENLDVSVYVASIAEVEKGNERKQLVAHSLCNTLNSNMRWLKFYINSDNEIVAESDAIISPNTAGDVCTMLLMKTIEVVDSTYPVIMTSLWTL